jgi:hypothetical protein
MRAKVSPSTDSAWPASPAQFRHTLCRGLFARQTPARGVDKQRSDPFVLTDEHMALPEPATRPWGRQIHWLVARPQTALTAGFRHPTSHQIKAAADLVAGCAAR